MTKPTLLIVDDDEDICVQMKWALADSYEVVTAGDRPSALAAFAAQKPAATLLDLGLPPRPNAPDEGLAALSALLELDPLGKVIVVSGQGDKQNALRAVGSGAYDFLCKPVEMDELRLVLQRCVYVAELEREYRAMQQGGSGEGLDDMLGASPQMQAVFTFIRKVGPTSAPVLILGASGTGKEMVARALHRRSPQAAGPFVAISCNTIPETLLESELFGHEKGSFTGAVERRKGKFELAEGGTIFLDEIGDISPKVQVDLLRVLQERRFFRVGGSEEVSVDVRVVAATNVDLAEAVKQGRFRDDLFYRLNVVAIHLPPLRERPEDIPLLARSFLERLSHELGKEAEDLSEGALKALLAHRWPGNVRELENAVERALVTAKGRVLTEDDFAFLRPVSEAAPGWSVPTHLPLADVEKAVIAATLRRNDGNVKETAAVLGIDRSTLYDKLKRYAIER